MNLVRRLLLLLLCLVLVLNGTALAHAGAASGHGDRDDAAQVETAVDAAPPCHEASEPPVSHAAMPMTAMLDASDAVDAPCCDDMTGCDQACVAAAAALVPERIAPAAERFRTAVPTVAVHARGSPPAYPPIRPPIAA